MDWMNILIPAGMILAGLLVIGLIITRLYVRSTKERTYVRTGFGGQKVIMNGGALVVPVLHETMPINMNTLRLTVMRKNTDALITKDKLRVDVTAEFYVRVKPDAEAIAVAAQTLGRRTIDPNAVKELVEGKFVDALRSVAAGLTMEELHTSRTAFVQTVQQVSAADLAMNGLELESVSLTGLDQTSREHFNENNAFDAEGLTILTRQIELRKKERNEVEQETAVLIAEKNREANQRRLEIQRMDTEATLSQEREVAFLEAQQRAQIAAEEAKRLEEAETARIAQERAVTTAEVQRDQAIRAAEIARDRTVQEQTIEREKAIQLAEQDRNIEVARRSEEESKAKALADAARAEAVKAAQAVVTAEKTAAAQRDKIVAVLQAEQEAEAQAAGIRVTASAEKQAAADRAEAARSLAQGEADAVRLKAEGDAAAEKLLAEAAEIRFKVDAEGQRQLNDAANRLEQRVLDNRERLATLEVLPQVIAESVKPMEKIGNISVVDVRGFGGDSQPIGPGGEGLIAGGNLADQAVSAALRYRSQAPVLDALMKEVGLDGSSLSEITASATSPARRGRAPQKAE